MEITHAEIDAVLDAQGRFVWTPNAVTLEGQQNIPCDLQAGENLHAFLRRHVPGIDSGAWSVSIAGAMVPRAMWANTYPRHGMHIACRATVGKQVVQLVAMAALTYFTLGIGGAGGWVAATFGKAVAFGAFMAGSILINKVLGPKVPKPGDLSAKAVYSLTSQRNSMRAYEPLPVLWGQMRVTPDLANQPYTWFAGDDQYLSMHLLGGINVHSAADLAIGDTPLADYNDVQVYYNGFAGHANEVPPLYSNADSISGGQLVTLDGSAGWITRTTSADTVRVEIDIEGVLVYVSGGGSYRENAVTIDVQMRLHGQGDWFAVLQQRIGSWNSDTVRRTLGFNVPAGQHDVRVRSSAASRPTPIKAQVDLSWLTMRSIQTDNTDYGQWGRIAIKIRATGQLSGSLDTVRATYRAKPMPVWNGTAWVTATTRETGLSNPGAILLQTLRGVYAKGEDGQDVLQFGYGLPDEMIDIEGLKAFMLHCAAHGYTYDRWITGQMSLGDFCQEVALAGMGEFSWTDGSRPTAVFVSAGQPVSAVVNMANMLKASFSVDYSLSNTADGIEYQYVDRDKGFETQTLRVLAPGAATMLNPARVTGEGVTTEAHAAVMARYHLAQSLYQYKDISYGADIEHLDYRRLSVLSLSHDLTQWGFGGRLEGIQVLAGQIQVRLGEAVPALSSPHLGLRIPGERDYRVWPVQPFEGQSDTLTLVGDWPQGIPLPGNNADNPAHDTLWCYDFKATPGYRVRVVGMEPESDLKGAKINCVPEGPEFWDYVLNGVYVPAPTQSSLPQLGRPSVKNLRVTEQVNVQGGTEWYELHVVWDVEGDYDHAQVWAGIDGSELRLVDGNVTGARSSFRIDSAGEWLIRVTPYGPGALAGQSDSHLYVTAGVALPPYNPATFGVMQVEGGLRRFAWAYTGDRPASLAGVQIRYLPGDVPASAAQWDEMQPIGGADDIYTAQFETTRPAAGTWTFALRAINTAGELATGVVRHVAQLDQVFDDIFQPDLQPPPKPTGFDVTAALTSALLQTDPPGYAMGHGHDVTTFYVAEVTAAAPDPGFAQARLALASPEYIGTVAVELGKTYRWWAKWKTVDGVESQAPAGPITLTVGKVGDHDLADDLDLAAKLADGSITAAKLAAQAIDATKFASGIEPVTIVASGNLPTVKSTSTIVYGGKLYRWDGSKYTAAVPTADLSGTIGNAQLANNAVTVAKIAAGAVDAGKIAAGAVTAEKLAAQAIDATKFASGIEPVSIIASGNLPTVKSTSTIVYGGKLYRWDGSKYTAATAAADVAGQLTDAQLAAISAAKLTGQITGTQITDKAISTAKLAAGAVTANEIAANAVTAVKIAANAVEAGKIATNAVTADKIAANSVTTAKIAAGAVTAAEIAANAVTATQLAANAVTAGAIKAGEVTAGKLATDSVVAANIAANAVTTAKIATGAVTANEIAANAVTAVKIAANAVEAGKIAANAVTADKIAANSVTTAKIAAGAVTATQIAANAITASKIALTDTTNLIADQDMLDSAAWSIGAGWVIVPTTLGAFASANIGQFAYNAAATGVSANLYCKQFSVEPGSEYYFEVQGRMADAAASGAVRLRVYWYNGTGASISPSPQTVGTLALNGTAIITLGKRMVAPAGAKRALFAMAVVHGSTTGTVEAGGQVVRRMASAELIVDGAITATKLAANSIAVGTAAIQAGAIVNAHIGNLSADKINAGTLAAARIAAGSIDAGKLAANAVTADKIAANAVTAAKMSVANLASVSANLGTVTAGRIQNAANTSYWNLGATGATTMLKLGNDLTYDETNGLKINKLNVIGTAQIADGAVSTTANTTFAGPFYLPLDPSDANGNALETAIGNVSIPANRTVIVQVQFDVVLNPLTGQGPPSYGSWVESQNRGAMYFRVGGKGFSQAAIYATNILTQSGSNLVYAAGPAQTIVSPTFIIPSSPSSQTLTISAWVWIYSHESGVASPANRRISNVKVAMVQILR